jgi:hypothetical protein
VLIDADVGVVNPSFLFNSSGLMQNLSCGGSVVSGNIFIVRACSVIPISCGLDGIGKNYERF